MAEATVDWQVNEDSLLYARWARGFRSGGYSMRQAASESLTATKVGAMNAQGFALDQIHPGWRWLVRKQVDYL